MRWGEGGPWDVQHQAPPPNGDVPLPIAASCIRTPSHHHSQPLLIHFPWEALEEGDRGAPSLTVRSPKKGGREVGQHPGWSTQLWASLASRGSCWEPKQAAWAPPLHPAPGGGVCTHHGFGLQAPRASSSSIVPVLVNHSATEIAPAGLKNSR